MPWDFDDYRLHFGFTSEYGQSLAELFGKVNGKRIIEFGSGDGSLAARLTAQGAVVVGVESSPSLLALARRDYPDIEFITSDPAQYCPAQPADLVIANSILHLIPFEQQSDTIGAAFAALKEGGHFVAEIGGKGNAAKVFSTVKAACMSRGNHPECRFYTPSLGEFVSLLEQQGFTVEYAVYYARPMMLPAGDGLADWIRMFLELPLAKLDEQTREEVIAESVAKLRPTLFYDRSWHVDLVRIRIKAIKSPLPPIGDSTVPVKAWNRD